MPFYENPQFWSATVAGAALAVSLGPYLYRWARPGRLDVDAFPTFALSHEFGNPLAQVHLILSNVGGRRFRVRSIQLLIRRKDAQPLTMQAGGYFPLPADKTPVLLAPFRIEPGGEWAHNVNFVTQPDREDEKNLRGWRSKIEQDIRRKRALPENKDRMMEADDQFVSPLV